MSGFWVAAVVRSFWVLSQACIVIVVPDEDES